MRTDNMSPIGKYRLQTGARQISYVYRQCHMRNVI